MQIYIIHVFIQYLWVVYTEIYTENPDVHWAHTSSCVYISAFKGVYFTYTTQTHCIKYLYYVTGLLKFLKILYFLYTDRVHSTTAIVQRHLKLYRQLKMWKRTLKTAYKWNYGTTQCIYEENSEYLCFWTMLEHF